jgi:preprotein translocase subunit SecF
MAKSHKNKRIDARFGKKTANVSKPKEKISTHVKTEGHEKKRSFYDKYYKQLIIIPFVILLAAIVIISVQYAQTGEFINKGISLKGGTAITMTSDLVTLDEINIVNLENTLRENHPKADISIRTQNQLSEIVAIEVEVDIFDQEELIGFKQSLITAVPELTLEEIGQNIRTSGSALGQTFFKQIIKAMIMAFILMGIVVFIQFRVPIPSLAVILAAFSDIVVTLAVINLLGIKVSTAGIAAFLMLIGYSVDTDILLSTRVLKNKEGTVYERVVSALKTGLTMNITTLVAVTIALIVSESPVITQIMTIIFIGLIVDMINTWFQNAGILRLYVEKKEREKKMKGGDSSE